MSKPCVFVVSREYPPNIIGGTSTVARNLSVGLHLLGWDVVAISSNSDTDHDTVDQLDGVEVHRVGTGVVYNEHTSLSTDSLRTHRRLLAAMDSAVGRFGRPDIVALPDLFCYPEARIFTSRLQVPLVNVLLQDFRTLTLHDRGEHRVTSGVSATAKDLFRLEHKAVANSDAVVFISHALSDAVNANYPDVVAEQRVIHLGIDPSELSAVAADQDRRRELVASLPVEARDRPLVVACGRLVPVKGFTALLAAVANLHGRGHYIHLVIVGQGPEAPLLSAEADRLGVRADVTFVENVPRLDSLTWMSAATVAVVPSLWESFCYVCAEFMALGRPVVATAIDSLNELMPSDRFGYKIPVSVKNGVRSVDPTDIADGLEAAITDPADAGRRADQGQSRIHSEFANERFAAEFSTFGSELIGTSA